jgi:tetratricopeptide (TPR) repeat protein
MSHSNKISIGLGLLLIGAIGVFSFGLATFINPEFRDLWIWRWERATTYLRGVVTPIQEMPTAQPKAESMAPTAPVTALPPTMTLEIAKNTPIPTQIAASTPLPTPTLPPLPAKMELSPPDWEKQEINNCGPDTLAFYLKYYGWKGKQTDISDVIKPIPQDRNVNVEELNYYVRSKAGWLQTIYRVNGTIDYLRSLIANGIPVMVEVGHIYEQTFWPNDDHWAGHYLLLTGYDDAKKLFISQDSYFGANSPVPYAELERNWEPFNHVYILVYQPEKEDIIKAILGADWDETANRQRALDEAKVIAQKDPKNAYAWFNIGSNQVYFEQYILASQAYDKARELKLPQRMLRYQFGPFIAYFNANRIDDLMSISDYALIITPNSEEALLWRGWGLYRQGKKWDGVELWKKALEARPDYRDAKYAIDFARDN